MEHKSSKEISSDEKDFFLNCDLFKSSTEGRLISINEKYLALANKSRGKINIVDSNDLKKLTKENLISIDDNPILDMEFSPFDNNILAYVNENNSVIISRLVEQNKKIKLNKNFDVFQSTKNGLNFVNFNPVASNIMCSGTIFGYIDIWDSNNLKEIYRQPPQVKNLTSLQWSPNGKYISNTTRRAFFNIFDIRDNKYFIQNQIDKFSESGKIYFNWIDDTNIVAISHNGKERIMILFDIRNQSQNAKIKEYSFAKIDEKKETDAIPFVNQEFKLIYSVGKDKSNIKIYDYSSSKLEKLSQEIIVKESNSYSVLYPRQFLNRNNREIDRIVRCDKDKSCIYYVNIKLPKKYSGFNRDLYSTDKVKRPLYTNENRKEIIEGKIKEETINNNINNINNKDDLINKEKNKAKFPNNYIKTNGNKIFMENNKLKNKENGTVNNKNLNQNKGKIINANKPKDDIKSKALKLENNNVKENELKKDKKEEIKPNDQKEKKIIEKKNQINKEKTKDNINKPNLKENKKIKQQKKIMKNRKNP